MSCVRVQGEWGVCRWDHPIDVHLAMSDARGWPRLALHIWRHDEWGRNEVVGHALCPLPSSTGEHIREVAATRPSGSWWEQLVSQAGGPVPRYATGDLETAFAGSGDPSADRSSLSVVTAGTVVVQVRVLISQAAGTGLIFAPMTRADRALAAAASSEGLLAIPRVRAAREAARAAAAASATASIMSQLNAAASAAAAGRDTPSDTSSLAPGW